MPASKKLNVVYEEAAKSLSATPSKKNHSGPGFGKPYRKKWKFGPINFILSMTTVAEYYKPRFGDGIWETFDEAVAAFGAATIHDKLIHWKPENQYENS